MRRDIEGSGKLIFDENSVFRSSLNFCFLDFLFIILEKLKALW